jgi:nucleoside-diphosphate-sugar epimerase
MAKILIVGCGSIGSELANVLSAKGHQVTGLKRKPPLSGPIDYVAADISSPDGLANLDTDFTQAFFIVSPDGRNEQSYRAVYESGLNNLLAKLPEAHWLMVSSTSVYGQSHGEWVNEDSVAEPGNITSRLIRQAEQRLIALNPANIVIRFSGIYGPGRDHLLRQAMQTPSIQQTPSYFTNRIHQQDCVGVLAFLLEQHLAGKALAQCYLASDDDPAPMWEVMNWLAEHLHCPPPTARDGGSIATGREPVRPTIKAVDADAIMNKRCSNARLKALGYRFRYPSYKDGYLELIDN